MPVNPPMTVPVDPHLLAQWRFDERRRSDEGRDASSHGATTVLGRWPDRIEFRSRTELPGVLESARAIAAVTEGPAYRAQLTELAGRIAALAPPSGSDEAPGAAPEPAAEFAAISDDWLSRLDASISGPVQPAAQDATFVAPPAAAEADAGLPDFLVPREPAAAPEEDAAPEEEDDAFYVPPALDTAPAPPHAEAAEPPPPHAASVPVLDFVVEPDEEPAHEDAADGPTAGHEAGPSSPAGFAPEAAAAPGGEAHGSAGDAAAVCGRLAALGGEMGMQVWGSAAGSGQAPGMAGLDPAVVRQLGAFDVVWSRDGAVTAAFLVDPPSAAEALLTLSDVLVLRPGVEVPFYLVAPESSRDRLRAVAARPTFARQSPPVGDALGFIGFGALEQALASVAAFLRYLRPEFVQALAERL